MPRCRLCNSSSNPVSKEIGVCANRLKAKAGEALPLARFIASINPEIPYSLLAFYTHFYMSDIPLVSRYNAEKCLQAAREEGVRNLRLGNVHLLR